MQFEPCMNFLKTEISVCLIEAGRVCIPILYPHQVTKENFTASRIKQEKKKKVILNILVAGN